MGVELLPRGEEQGVLWCDGSRSMELPAGARVEVTRSETPVLLARVHQTPFSQRLVDKFNLPTTGWRGPVEASNTLPSTAPPPTTPRKHDAVVVGRSGQG